MISSSSNQDLKDRIENFFFAYDIQQNIKEDTHQVLNIFLLAVSIQPNNNDIMQKKNICKIFISLVKKLSKLDNIDCQLNFFTVLIVLFLKYSAYIQLRRYLNFAKQ